jgi:predicted small secreted protein
LAGDKTMKKLLLIVTAMAFLATGCKTLNGAKQGIFGGVPAVENEKGNIPEKSYPDTEVTTKYAFGYLSGLHIALAVGLFVVNPIAGGAYLGANAIYGAARNIGD